MRIFLGTPVVFLVLCMVLLAGCAAKRDARETPQERLPQQRNHSAQAGEADPWRTLDRPRWAAVLDAAHMGSAVPHTRLGLLSAEGFVVTTGRCPDCPVPEAALWYFRDDIVAVPRHGLPLSGRVRLPAGPDDLPYPPLVWLGAPEIMKGARITEGGGRLEGPSGSMPLALAPRIPTNRAWPDRSTLDFLSGRSLRIRGATLRQGDEPLFVVRTPWPEDSRIEASRLALEPLKEGETLDALVRTAHAHPDDGNRDVYPTRLLWERRPGALREWADRPVLALVLNAAQGDDDGAHAGHLAIATGHFGPRGEWADWLVANYYPIEDKNDKGIITSLLPMDNYLMDVNSGQAWYRPNYVLAAVLRGPGVPRRVQAALQEVFHDYYCHRIEYDRARRNSTAMGIDTLRDLGWNIPEAGATSRVAGALAFPFAAVIQGGIDDGREAYATFAAEKTRLLPKVAFEAAGHDLLRLVKNEVVAERRLTAFERMLAVEVEAIFFLYFPQVPSSRAVGTYPVGSLFEYAFRVPWRASRRQTAPDAGKWPFPQELAERCAPPAGEPRR